MAVLAGLGAVDWVISFAEDSPSVLEAAAPTGGVVKGGDYQLDQVVGARYRPGWW